MFRANELDALSWIMVVLMQIKEIQYDCEHAKIGFWCVCVCVCVLCLGVCVESNLTIYFHKSMKKEISANVMFHFVLSLYFMFPYKSPNKET